MNKCGNCQHFIGMGDWDLCCELKHEGYPMGFLCYEDTDACEKFTPIELRTCYCPLCDKHFRIRSNKSSGHCPDCGHHVVLREVEVADE